MINIKNAKYINKGNTYIDVEVKHPIHGWIPYTFIDDAIDESYDEEIREWLKSNSVTPFEAHVITIEETQQLFRMKRDRLLREVDIKINIAMDENDPSVLLLREYRIALRNATINWVMPKELT